MIKLMHKIPDKPHQDGHLLVSFTTPAANIKRKSSHFTSQKHRRSLDDVISIFEWIIGATTIVMKPLSRSIVSHWKYKKVWPTWYNERYKIHKMKNIKVLQTFW